MNFDNVRRFRSAAQGGADRLEVCGNLGIGGGTTPSLGLTRAIQRALPHLPIMVSFPLSITHKSYVIVIRITRFVDLRDLKAMIRPRVGDFLYSQEELDVMLEDIGLFKGVGVAGVVLGVLDLDGTVDVPRTRMWVFDPPLAII